MTLDEMIARRDALLAARWRGVRTVEIEGRRVTFATDAEMGAAGNTPRNRVLHCRNILVYPVTVERLSFRCALFSYEFAAQEPPLNR
ncbi:MAG: hypothetical protein EXQ84_02055 [Rhodospirillaceae bacterium]|nr:hypothetical protein [Rhodospirillaceae bacterium]